MKKTDGNSENKKRPHVKYRNNILSLTAENESVFSNVSVPNLKKKLQKNKNGTLIYLCRKYQLQAHPHLLSSNKEDLKTETSFNRGLKTEFL
jgi:hypothetical protein